MIQSRSFNVALPVVITTVVTFAMLAAVHLSSRQASTANAEAIKVIQEELKVISKNVARKLDDEVVVRLEVLLADMKIFQKELEARTDDRFRSREFEAFMKANPQLHRPKEDHGD